MPLIAIRHYRRQRKFDTARQREISAYKIGGRGLAVYAIQTAACNAYKLTLKGHSDYTYIDVSSATEVSTDPNGYLVVEATDAAMQLIEEKNRTLGDTFSVCHWNVETGQWETFPARDRAAMPVLDRYRPRFTPGATGAITTSDPLEGNDLTATRSDKDGGDTWWWIGGETYAVRDRLKVAGCRWSMKRRQWYSVGQELPRAILDLMGLDGEASSTDTDPAPPADEAPA